MASVYKEKNGWVLQVGAKASRRVRRLGKLTKAGAANVQVHVTAIELARKAATGLPPATVSWLSEITDELHHVIATLGLVAARQGLVNDGIPIAIGLMWDEYLARRPGLKAWSKSNLTQTKLRCVEFFKLRPVDTITAADAKDFRRWLEAQTYAQATVVGFIKKTGQLFNDAIERELLTKNPFRKIGGGTQVNKERRHFVTREDIAKVIAVAPDAQWRLLLALGRFAGIRVPSEAQGLTRADIDFSRNRMIIRSPKTEKQGKPRREIPIWPELVKPLRERLAEMAPGEARLLPMLHADYNPHTHTLRLIKRAGVTKWPKVWQNMRSTRETELMAEGWPLFKVCAWIGNTEKVAAAHYLQITDEDFAKASGVKSVAPSSGQAAHTANQKRQDPHFHAGIAVNAGLEPYEVAQDRGGITHRKPRERRDFRRSAVRRVALSPSARVEIVARKLKRLGRGAGR